MGFSLRMLLVDKDDRLYRLASIKFMAMMHDPARYRFQQFAGQRIRGACAIVKLVDRHAIQVVRTTFDILTFDDGGHFDADIFGQQQKSRGGSLMASLVAKQRDGRNGGASIIDASREFIARGGCWTPSKTLASAIDDAALGRTKCKQL